MAWGVDLIGTLLAIGLGICAAIAWTRYKKVLPPVLFFSETAFLKKIPPTLKVRWQHAPEFLLWGVIALLFLALMDPYLLVSRSKAPEENEQISAPASGTPPPVEGIAIYLALDQSGSMEEEIKARDSTGRLYKTSKINLLKSITEKFIKGDPTTGLEGLQNDMIGMITFARTPQVVSPLTLDHDELLRHLKELDIMRIKDQDGTSIGYAIYKTANLIVSTRHFAEELISEGKPAYTIQNSVIILITDGFQELNPLDYGNKLRTMPVEAAAKFAADHGIRVYIVNVEPSFASNDYEASRKLMMRVTKMTGGLFFLATESQNLEEILKTIEQLEKSALPSPEGGGSYSLLGGQPPGQLEKWHLAPYLLSIAAFAFILSIIAECLWLRKVP